MTAQVYDPRESALVAVLVTIRPLDEADPPHKVTGFALYADCPLAVTPVIHFDDGQWVDRSASHGWHITHRPTGFSLGKKPWPTRKEALAVLERCDPAFAAWPLAIGTEGDIATIACAAKFRYACGGVAA